MMPDEAAAASAWAEHHNQGGSNVYWQVNDSERTDAKVKESEMQRARFVWADIDPKIGVGVSYADARQDLFERILPTLQELGCITVDSGHGLQALFRLDAMIDLTDAASRDVYSKINRGVGERYEGPGTANADRILRLPGTLNYPSLAKLEKGYPKDPALARIISSSERVFSRNELELLIRQAPGGTTVAACATAARIAPASTITPELQKRFDDFLLRNESASKRYQGGVDGLKDRSGSARDMSMVDMMNLHGFSKDEIRTLLESWQHGSHGGRKQGDRHWDRMWEKAESARHQDALFTTDCVSMVGTTPNLAPSNSGTVPPAPTTNRFKLHTVADLKAMPLPPWRIKGILPQQGLASIYGPSGSGKSFLAIDCAARISLGLNWFGHRVSQCPVVYVALEGQLAIQKRFTAWERHWKQAIPPTMRVMIDSLTLFNSGDIGEFAVAVTAEGADNGVIFIDTLNQSAPGADENAPKDMGQIIANAKQLQQLTQSLVVLVHHAGKDLTRGLRGHSSLVAALDSAIDVKREHTDRSWSLAKNKDGRDGLTSGFQLQPVTIGQDADGVDITSCVVVPNSQNIFKPKPPKPRGAHQTVALREFMKLYHQAPAPPSKCSKTIKLEDAIAAVSVALIVDDPKRKRERAQEAIQGLIASDFLGHKDGHLWPT